MYIWTLTVQWPFIYCNFNAVAYIAQVLWSLLCMVQERAADAWSSNHWSPVLVLSVCGTGRCRCRRGRVSSKGCSSSKGRGERGGGGGGRQRGGSSSNSNSGCIPFHKRSPPAPLPSPDEVVLDQCGVTAIEESGLMQAAARYHC